MNNRPIGVFDSGLGGMSCLLPLQKALPNESIIYFGDTARTPYGDKEPETIRYFTCQVADFLVSQGVKILVIACNTISALCTETLRQRYPHIPVVDIITPTVSHVLQNQENTNNIGVIATKATIKSGMYHKLLRGGGFQGEIHSTACPLFVPLIESGFRDGVVVESVVAHYLDRFVAERNLDSLILGCTHYPFIESSIRKLYPELQIINPSQIITEQVCKILREQDLAAAPDHRVSHTFYASDLSETFLDMIRHASTTRDYSVEFQAFKEVYQHI